MAAHATVTILRAMTQIYKRWWKPVRAPSQSSAKVRKLHTTDVLRVTPEVNLNLIESSVAFLTENGRQVIYDAEHFFDGFNDDADYALQTLKTAADAGAKMSRAL